MNRVIDFLSGLITPVFFLVVSTTIWAQTDSIRIKLPDILSDTIDYSYSVLDEQALAIANPENQHIIITNRQGEILNEIRCNDLKGRFSRDNRFNYPKILALIYQEGKLFVLFRSQIHNFLRHSMNYYLIDFRLKTSEYTIQKWDIKLDGKQYKLPFSLPSLNEVFYDPERKVYYFPLAIDQGKDTGFKRNCNEWFQQSNKIGAVNQEGEMVAAFGKWSPVYTQHPCIIYLGGSTMAYNRKRGELASQELANMNLQVYNLDNTQLLTDEDSSKSDFPVIKSYYDRLVNGIHYFMTQDYYGKITYDSVNNVYYRYYRPAVKDTTSRDLEYEKMLRQYFDDEIKACPSFSNQREAQKEMLRNAPKYYQVLNEDGEVISSIKIPEWIEADTYYGAPDIFYFEKGSIWVAETKDWVKNRQFKLYKLDVPGI